VCPTQSNRDFFQSFHPSGRRLSTNMPRTSLRDSAGSFASTCVRGLLARNAKRRPNSPDEPTRLSSPRSLVSFSCSVRSAIALVCAESKNAPMTTGTVDLRTSAKSRANNPATIDIFILIFAFGSRCRFCAIKVETPVQVSKPSFACISSRAKFSWLSRPEPSVLGSPSNIPLWPGCDPCEPGSSNENKPSGTRWSNVSDAPRIKP